MIVKVDLYEGKALLLDSNGQIWQITIDYNDQPMIRLLDRTHQITELLTPKLARYIKEA